MKRLLRRIKDRLIRSQGGQALILFVFTFVALLAVVGIAVDVGNLYVHYSHLRRAVDSAVVAAVGQYRENRTSADIYYTVVEAAQLQLPGVENVRFYWCSPPLDIVTEVSGGTYDAHDPRLCSPDLPRKLIRVEANLPVNLVFLSLIWSNRVTLRAAAQAEAAVLNLVLLIDTSESMGWDPPCRRADFASDDALNACLEQCRAAGTCAPFDNPGGGVSVRSAAAGFVNALMRDAVDRFAVYHFDKTPVITPSVELFPCDDPPGRVVAITSTVSSGMVVSLTTRKSDVLGAINDRGRLNVYVRPRACEGPICCTSPTHVGGTLGQESPLYGPGYGYRWGSTNLGGGLREAIGELVSRGSTDAAVWVIVLISDGAANMTDQAADVNDWWTCPAPRYLVEEKGFPDLRTLCRQEHLVGHCQAPTCRDIDNTNPKLPQPALTTRHCPSREICQDTRFCDDPLNCKATSWYTNWGETITETIMWHYDADDYARDMADLASSHKIAIFAVGLGTRLGGDGEELLRYIADVGDDGDLRTAPCGSDAYWDDEVVSPLPGQFQQCGNYYYAADAAQLVRALEDIAKRIFSRITE